MFWRFSGILFSFFIVWIICLIFLFWVNFNAPVYGILSPKDLLQQCQDICRFNDWVCSNAPRSRLYAPEWLTQEVAHHIWYNNWFEGVNRSSFIGSFGQKYVSWDRVATELFLIHFTSTVQSYNWACTKEALLFLDKMAAILETIFQDAFSLIKMYEFRLSFHWILFLMVQLTIFQHMFR